MHKSSVSHLLQEPRIIISTKEKSTPVLWKRKFRIYPSFKNGMAKHSRVKYQIFPLASNHLSIKLSTLITFIEIIQIMHTKGGFKVGSRSQENHEIKQSYWWRGANWMDARSSHYLTQFQTIQKRCCRWSITNLQGNFLAPTWSQRPKKEGTDSMKLIFPLLFDFGSSARVQQWVRKGVFLDRTCKRTLRWVGIPFPRFNCYQRWTKNGSD